MQYFSFKKMSKYLDFFKKEKYLNKFMIFSHIQEIF
jgi:hypothetical protein